MKVLKVTVMLLFFLQLTSCKKPENRSCWKGAGSPISKIIVLPNFQQMEIHQRLKIELIQDSVSFMEVIAGENLVNFIDWTVVDGKLEIWNLNKCPFLRYKNDEVTLKIHFTVLSKLIYWGSELLTNEDTIQTNHLDVLMNDGAGDLDLTVIANSINVVNPHGFSNISLGGTCDFLRLDIDGYGRFDARQMQVTDSISLMYASNGISYLSANQVKLKAELSSSGDIWYYGQPLLIKKIRYSSGDLIQK
ncbi:MAG: hypothetical protein RLZZ585_522 [Bacteroidota bacterium]|jgi:hypothetical protein